MSLSIRRVVKPKLRASVLIRKCVPDRWWLATMTFEGRAGRSDVWGIEKATAPSGRSRGGLPDEGRETAQGAVSHLLHHGEERGPERLGLPSQVRGVGGLVGGERHQVLRERAGALVVGRVDEAVVSRRELLDVRRAQIDRDRAGGQRVEELLGDVVAIDSVL